MLTSLDVKITLFPLALRRGELAGSAMFKKWCTDWVRSIEAPISFTAVLVLVTSNGPLMANRNTEKSDGFNLLPWVSANVTVALMTSPFLKNLPLGGFETVSVS